MKAVNLIPGDSRRGPRGRSVGVPSSPGYAVIGVLLVVLGFVTIYVLTNNTISERRTKLTTLQAQASQERVVASQLTNYASFQQLAQARADTVREIATARFDWHSALAQLSKVVPPSTSLQTLSGTVAPGAAVSGPSGGSSGAGSTLRTDLSVPAIELTGCTKSQDDVARLMSRLRVMDGVTRVTLSNSQKSASAQTGTGVTSSTSSGAAGCGSDTPSFDMVVFFSTLANAGATGVTGVGAVPVSSTTTPGAVK